MRFAVAVASGLVWLVGASSALAQLSVEVDGRGVLAEVKVGGLVYLDDVAASLVKPGWSGTLADQRGVDPDSVHVYKKGVTTTYAMPLEGESFTGQLIERVTRNGDEVELRYEVIPDADMEIECILLRGSLATAAHAGKTSYLVGGPKPARGVLPRELNLARYILYQGDPEWLGFAATEVGGLRAIPRDMGLQLQDDRRWSAPMFRLLATAGGGEHLMRKPIRFGLSLQAAAVGRLEDDWKHDATAGSRRVEGRSR